MAWNRVRLVSWIVGLLLVEGLALGASRLEFPRLALQATEILGIAIANPNPESADLMLTAFAEDGTVLDNRALLIPPNSQVSVLASEIFESEDVDLSEVAWFRAQSMTNDLTGFFLFLDETNGQLDGADLPMRSRNLIFPQIEGNDTAASQINLVNPGGSEADITALLRQGTQVQQRIFKLPARGARQFDVREFFELDSITPPASLEFLSDEDLIGFQLIVYSEGDLVGLNARSRSERLSVLYFPQMVLGGGFTNRLALRNQSGESVTLVISAHAPDGSLMDLPGNPVEMELEGGGVLQGELAPLFGFDPEMPETGWLQVQADRPAITGEVAYRVEQSGAAAAVAALERGSRRILLSHLATTLDFFTGVALLNPGQFPAAIRGVAVSAAGDELGRFDLVLTPGQRISQLITELIPEADGQNGGLVWVESDSPIFATALFGNGTSLLANIPPQFAPEQFRADSTFPDRPAIEPGQAAVLAGQEVQFSSDSMVTWQVNGRTGGAETFGLVDTQGLYSSPDSLPELKTVSLSAVSDEGVAAAAIDLLASNDVVVVPQTLTRLAHLPRANRTFVSGPAIDPAGSNNSDTLFEVIDAELIATRDFDFSVQTLLQVTVDEVETLALLTSDGEIYLYEPLSDHLELLPESGSTSAIAWDPISGSLLAASETGLRGFELGAEVPAEGLSTATRSWPAREYSLGMDGALLTSLSIDRCSGDIFLATETGELYRFLRAEGKRELLADLAPPGRLLSTYRHGVSCPQALELLALDGEGLLNLLNPDSGVLIETWSSSESVQDLGIDTSGRILVLQDQQSESRLLAFETEATYDSAPLNPPRIELLPLVSQAPGLDLEVISSTAVAGQTAAFSLYLRSESLPSALVFSLNIDDRALLFDPGDLNEDGIPDSILPLFSGDFALTVQYDAEDEDGELDIVIADLAAPFSSLESGKLLTISFQVAGDWEGSSDLLFSLAPTASAADLEATRIEFDEVQMGTVTVSRKR